MLTRIRRFRRFMWISGIVALTVLIFAARLLVVGTYEPAFFVGASFFGFIWLVVYLRDKARQLEEKRKQLWKQKHRTVENVRPLIYRECTRFWTKENEMRLVEPLLNLGPGPYLDADIDRIIAQRPDIDYTESYFSLIKKDILWPRFLAFRGYQWSEQLWEEVDKKTPVMPKDWDGGSALPWTPTWAMRIG